MKVHPSVTLGKADAAIEAGNPAGYCVKCGAEAEGIEPATARDRECDSCGEHGVYGVELLHEILHPW